MVNGMKKQTSLGRLLSLMTALALLLSLCVVSAAAAEDSTTPAAPFENTSGDGGENYISLCDARTFQAMVPVDLTEEEAKAAAETVVWSLDYDEASGYVDPELFPNHTQGGPLEHIIAAKAVCFGEALKPEFKDYARRIVENAQAMAAQLQARGVKLVSGGTDNHLMLVDLREEECTGKELETRLDSVHITANKNTVPGETRSPFVTSGVRLGTPAVTTRGMGEAEMKVIADCIADCIWHYDEKKDDISARVLALTKAFPLYE